MTLRDAGVGGDTASATLELSQNGVVSTVTLPTVPSEGFLLQPHTALPLYRERAGQKYWWKWLPGDSTVFVKYNRCVDADDFKRMSDRVPEQDARDARRRADRRVPEQLR
jgi:hypothetical protein